MLSRTIFGLRPKQPVSIVEGVRNLVLLSIFSFGFIGIRDSETPAANVVGEWRFNEGTGTTTTDGSGNGYTGTLTNGTAWVAGKYGQGLSFDGSNDYVNVADNGNFTLTPSVSYTWSGWVRNTGFKEWSTVWSQTLNSSTFFYFYAHTSSDPEGGPVTNGLSVYWYSGSSKLATHSNNNVLTAGSWSYVTVTYDASRSQATRFTIYVNGADVTNRSDVVSSGTLGTIDPTNIRIGSNQPYGEYFTGAMDEMRYYRRLLSVDEIRADMNTGITVDASPPTVAISSPATGSVSGTINITATAGDNVGVAGVQFLLDGNVLGSEDLTVPYSLSWNTSVVSNGNHTLSARVRDAAGNTATSAAVLVNVSNVDAQAPTVALSSPAAGNVAGTVTISANASDNIAVAGVQFLLDGAALGAEDISAPYSITWNSSAVTNGAHTLSARARDAAGNTGTSTVVSINVSNDIQPPSVSITPPAGNGVSGSITINANANDNVAVVGVTFLVDGAAIGNEDLSSPYSVSWNTAGTTNGTHSLTAKARDAAGNVAVSAVVPVVINNDLQAPVISVDLPAGTSVSGTIIISAKASDNVGVAGVQFLLDGAVLGSEDLTDPYSVSWASSSVTNGVHVITARARDVAGNIATSTGVTVVVSNSALVAAYSFNEMGGSTANDNSGNGNNGTLTNGPAWSATGKFGGAISFDGSNDYVNIVDANSLDLTNGMTLEAWVNPSNLSGYKTVICKENGTNNLAYTIAANNNTSNTFSQRPNARIRIGSNTRTVTGTSKLVANSWSHLACTYNGSIMRLYINGVQVSTFSTTGNIAATTNPLRIGGSVALGQYFSGLIDEVRIYTRELTQAEIAADMNTPVAPDLIPPTVSISAPAAGPVSGVITLNATASDNAGIAGVQFLLDGINIGTEDLSAPYSISWNSATVANGPHSLTARARDLAGNGSTAAPVALVVENDRVSPVVSIVSPIADTVAGTVDLNAESSDNIGVAGVQFLLNGSPLGVEDIVVPYSYSWNTTSVTDGNYSLVARARDAAGNVTVSGVVEVTVLNHPPDLQAPVITIVSPGGGAIEGTVTLSATAADNEGVIGVQFLLNGNPLGAEVLTAPYSLSFNTSNYSDGTYLITARARDAAGNVALSGTVTVTIANPPDAVSPTVTITAPAVGSVSGVVTLGATAVDNNSVVGVQFYVDGIGLGAEDLSAPYSAVWNTAGVGNGSHIVTARARDANGNYGVSAPLSVTVNNDVTAPVVSISAPLGGSTVAGTVNVTVNATDNVAVAGVQLLIDNGNFGPEDLSAPFTTAFNTTTVANGNHTVIAIARDAAGNIATSPAVTFVVDNTVTDILTAINFNEGSGTVAADISGKNHNGTLTSAAWTAGKYGQAVNLNGTNSYVNIADHNDYTLDPGKSYTWSAWIRNSSFKEWSTVWSQTINNSNFFYFYAHSTSDPDGGPVTNGISVYWFVNGGASKLGVHSSNNVLSAGTWSHVAVTYDASQPQAARFSIYVNGVDVTVRNDVASAGTITSINPTNIRIGSNQPFGEYFNGSIDDIRFYDRLLSPAQIATDMNTGISSDVIPPVVSVTSPANNTAISGIVTVTANASDNSAVSGVQFLVDGIPVGAEDVASPYSIILNTSTLTNGSHSISARARDATGNKSVSGVVSVVVNNDVAAPTISLVHPLAGTVAGTVELSATAADNIGVAGVQFLLNGNPVGGELLVSPYFFNWNSNSVEDGDYLLTVRARDAAGNTVVSEAVAISVINHPPDTELPGISIIGPGSGELTGTVSITAEANDNIGVEGVQFLVDGNPIGIEDRVAPYLISWNTLLSTNGQHLIGAKVRDAAGNMAEASVVTVFVNNPPDNDPPEIAITLPLPGIVSGMVNIAANAVDNAAVVGVRFLVDGVALGDEILAAPYSFAWNSRTVNNALHSIVAVARDATGNQAISPAVSVQVDNDLTPPQVTIMQPAAGTVMGTVVVNATASDNIGVTGVQFLIDGSNLGAEDLAAPYTASWNTTLVPNGTYVISARARDAVGNVSVDSVTVTIGNTMPLITNVSVTGITATSAIVSWTTNLPSGSQVSYGFTTVYGLTTLVDSAPVTSHSMLLDGLVPGRVYHGQAVSGNGISTPAYSGDFSFSTAGLAASLGSVNGRTVLAYPSGLVIPWTTVPGNGYDTVMYLAWRYLLNSVPNDPATGKPAYYSQSYLNPSTQTVANWPHNPAGLYGMLTESALKYYYYSGNGNVVQLAKDVALWHLDHGMTGPTDGWASVPYSSGDAGSLNYDGAAVGNNGNGQGDGDGFLEPDKIAELAYAWLCLYRFDGTIRFRDAAIQSASVLAAKVRNGNQTQSPWPFRVNARTGAILEEYCSNIIAYITLFDGLIGSGLGDTANYRAARNIAWNWMMSYPMQNNAWAQYFEDSGVQPYYNRNLNQYNALMVARYLAEHPEYDVNWETHVRGLISWVEATFGQSWFGATTIREQTPIFPYAMGSHTSRYASVNALLYERTGDLVAKEKAYRAFNWSTYMARINGVVIDGPDVQNQWFTDGYGDYVRHFMTGLGAVPEWSPSNQTHMVRSSSIIKSISYGLNSVGYVTSGETGVEVIHLNFNPARVMANGQPLSRRTDLNEPGWTLDVATKTIRIFHRNATQISVDGAGIGSDLIVRSRGR